MLKSYLVKNVDVIIDRPLGIKHPKWKYILHFKLWIYTKYYIR